jgi:predicted Fe-S protein YdhL (DUF1289 family)
MTAIPLFTQSELSQAFTFILPTKVAEELAERWWAEFADETDDRGYFLYEGPAERLGIPATEPQVVAAAGPLLPEAERFAQERAFWGSMTIAERVELLMRFSSFHFGLLSLVSPALHERLRAARKLSAEQADNGRAQMRRIVAAMRAGGGPAQ